MSDYLIQENAAMTEDDELYSFHIILVSDAEETMDLWLPKIPEGFFRFSDDLEYRFLEIRSLCGKWMLICKKPAFFSDVPLEHSYELPIKDGLTATVERGEKHYSVFAERIEKSQMVFHNYHTGTEAKVTIGSRPGCVICYDNPLIPENNAILICKAGKWKLEVVDDLCPVFVNGKRTDNRDLKLGDTVTIIGLRIIVGCGFLSISDGARDVHIDLLRLGKMDLAPIGYSRYSTEDVYRTEEHFFNRAPRKRISWDAEPIVVEGPPMSMDQKKIPLLLKMGSSMFMGGTAALAGNFTTLVSSVVFPFLSNRFSESQIKEYEQLRTVKYKEYLEGKRKEIQRACFAEQTYLNQKYPAMQTVIETVREQVHLWERRPLDNDFLCVRLGTGSKCMETPIEYPKRRFELEPDELMERMYELTEMAHEVDDVPIVLSFQKTNVCGISGVQEQVQELVQQIILQAAAFHSYDEVKMVFLVNSQDLEKLEEIRYLPHVWDDQRTIRLIATNEAEAYTVGEYIKEQTSILGTEQSSKATLQNRPYYLIFALDKKLLDSYEGFKEILAANEKRGISIVAAYEDLPKEVEKLITLESRHQNVCTTMSIDGGDDIVFSMDSLAADDGREAMSIIANTSLKTVARVQQLPKMVTFLEMCKVGRVEQLNPLKRWRENNPVKSLAAPVGIGTDGELMMLDLHEKRQGPHGLIAGMTGSGKSEFIITYILSLAVNYHPDEVAFLLIDYKGGGLAGAFENPQTGVKLPHLVGTITNLDGAMIQRSLMSIESELIRRQKIFNDTKSEVNEGTMDIYAYQKLYRAGRVSEPMPHLFIISDEFAELKQQQPEFMAKLVSAARIGRSLGIHLILATQKPSGVVDDQIRSNTKFRVCLRVQDRSDSMDMLKRSEAAELVDTGRFYLQVGYNEYFALGQSAWCGAQYEPQDTVLTQRDDALEFVDTTGQVIAKAKPKIRKKDSGMKQLVAIVQHLSALAETHGIKTRQLWQPPLPAHISLAQLQADIAEESGSMATVLGLMDDPGNLRQLPYLLDFETCGNILITGESGSGKTTMVQNILCNMAQKLSPSEFNFYALDYSSRMLKQFKALPHCGAVLQEEDAGSLDEFFKLINGLVAERKSLFSSLEVDSFKKARRLRKLPLVLVVIDNIAGLSGSKAGENHTYRLQQYLKNCANYGIKFILTASHLSDISSRIRQELSERICLYLADRYSYQEALGCKPTYIPPELPGRGLVVHEGCALEFHAATIGGVAEEKSTYSPIKQLVDELQKKYGIRDTAQRLPTADEEQEYEEFSMQFKPGRIPLGISKSNKKPVAMPLKQLSILGLYFGNPRGTVPILNNLLYAFAREQTEILAITRANESLFDPNSETKIHIVDGTKVEVLPCSTANLRMLQRALIATIHEREAIFQDYCNKHQIVVSDEEREELMFDVLRQITPPNLLLIESVTEFCQALNPVSSYSYETLFKKLRKSNTFVVGCFEPDAPEEISNNMVFSLFQQQDFLLFGGNFDRQDLYPWTPGTSAGKNLPFNSALMQYRMQTYALTMPCGKLDREKVDEDLESIF